VETALRLTHAFAGGKFNPLIRVDSGQLAEYLVDRFRVDVLFPVAETDRIRAFINSHGYLLWPSFPTEQLFQEDHRRRPFAMFVDIYHQVRRIHEDHIRGVTKPSIRASLFTWEDDEPLVKLLLASIGKYPAPSSTVPNYEELLERALNPERIQIRRDEVLPADLDTRLTPSRLCAEYLEAVGRGGDPGFYVGSVANFDDVVNFWNIRAAGTELVFFDPQHATRLKAVTEAHKRWLASLPLQRGQESGEIMVWARNFAEGYDLSTIGAVTVRNVDAELWSGRNAQPALRYWREQPVLGSVDEPGNPTVSFALPEKPTYRDHAATQYIALRVSGYDRSIGNGNVAFFPPSVPELNEYYSRALYRYSQVRAEPPDFGGSVSLIVSTDTSDITLRSLSSLEVTTHIFAHFGITAKPSPAGLVTTRLIAQMGGAQGCRVFKIEGVRTLIAKYRPDQAFGRTEANKTIGNYDEKAKRIQFAPFEDLFLEPGQSAKLSPQDALDFLLKRGVFRVGLELKCPHCELPFWLSIDEAKTQLECTYCGTVFDVTRQLRDRNWAYRRSGLFGRDDHQHGGIPVAVTLQQLHTSLSSLNRMLYTTCLQLTPSGAQINACETDLVVITSSHETPDRPQLLIGECKSAGGEITIADAQNLRKVADALRTRFNVFVLFAKTGSFAEQEINACALAQDEWRARVILLSKDELEPYHVYERHPGRDGLNQGGLTALAESTKVLYPALRPKGWDELERGPPPPLR
jgi:hypothetical protein